MVISLSMATGQNKPKLPDQVRATIRLKHVIRTEHAASQRRGRQDYLALAPSPSSRTEANFLTRGDHVSHGNSSAIPPLLQPWFASLLLKWFAA